MARCPSIRRAGLAVAAGLIALLISAPAQAELRRVDSWDLPPGEGPFTGVSAAPDGTVYAVGGFTRVYRFAPSGELLGRWGGPESGPGEVSQTQAASASRDGAVLVADGAHDRIARFDAAGRLLASWPVPTPVGVAAASDGHVYVSTRGGQIIRLTEGGVEESRWGGAVFERVAVSPQGTLFASVLADSFRAQVYRFGPGGTVAAKFPPLYGTGRGALGRDVARGLAATADGSVWVADLTNRRINHYSADGRFLAACGTLEPGPSALNSPGDVSVAPDGDLFVADGNSIVRLSERPSPGSLPCVPPRVRVSRVAVIPLTFVAAPSRRSPRGGGVLRFALSRPALVQLSLIALVPGRRVAGRCVSRPAGSHAPRCTVRRVLSRSSMRRGSGVNHSRVSGWVAGHRLQPGRYRVQVSAESDGGRSGPVSARFTLAPG
jgi:sugar lactone lactonase YvrE